MVGGDRLVEHDADPVAAARRRTRRCARRSSTSPSNARAARSSGRVGDRVAVVARGDRPSRPRSSVVVYASSRASGNISSRASERSFSSGWLPGPSVYPSVSVTVLHRRARSRLLSVTTSVAPRSTCGPQRGRVLGERRPSRRRAGPGRAGRRPTRRPCRHRRPRSPASRSSAFACTIGSGSSTGNTATGGGTSRSDGPPSACSSRNGYGVSLVGRGVAEQRRLPEPGRRRVEQPPQERPAGSPGSARTAGRCAARCRRRSSAGSSARSRPAAAGGPGCGRSNAFEQVRRRRRAVRDQLAGDVRAGP